MKILIVSSLFVASALFVGCSSQGYSHYDNETEAFSLIDKTAEEAIASSDLELCLGLPVKARYKDDQLDRDNIVIYPRSFCLWKYMESTRDIRTCIELEEAGVSPQSGADCFSYLSEKDPLPLQEQCRKISASNEQNTCLALVNRDIQYCENLESNVSKGWCIHDVVFRTRDIKSCLQIDNSAYGDNWKKIRNECVIVGALSATGEEKSLLCDSLVEDSSDTDIKEKCLIGNYRNVELVPLR